METMSFTADLHILLTPVFPDLGRHNLARGKEPNACATSVFLTAHTFELVRATHETTKSSIRPAGAIACLSGPNCDDSQPANAVGATETMKILVDATAVLEEGHGSYYYQ
ncbi:hypothetical protein [Brucella pituitosa]